MLHNWPLDAVPHVHGSRHGGLCATRSEHKPAEATFLGGTVFLGGRQNFGRPLRKKDVLELKSSQELFLQPHIRFLNMLIFLCKWIHHGFLLTPNTLT